MLATVLDQEGFDLVVFSFFRDNSIGLFYVSLRPTDLTKEILHYLYMGPSDGHIKNRLIFIRSS